MEKETADSGKMYFEDLPENIQEILLDLNVAGLKNKMAKDPEVAFDPRPGTNGRKRKGLPSKKRAPTR
jgi:hypothetical protein